MIASDIQRMRPDDRFHVDGFRVMVEPRRPWPRWLGWLGRLWERWFPPIPHDAVFTMTINDRPRVSVPVGMILGRSRDRVFVAAGGPIVLAPTDSFTLAIECPKGRGPRASSRVTMVVDGYFVRKRDRIADSIYHPPPRGYPTRT